MRAPTPTYTLLLAAVLAATAARADEWDNATESDDGAFTDNALFHGSVQQHDLATHVGPTVDQDWFILFLRPYSSYEVIVDGQTGDLLLGANQVQLVNWSGIPGQNGSVGEDPGIVRLKFGTLAGGGSNPAYVRVSNPGCATLCDLNDRYRIRSYDTTYTVPRFNNGGTQSTVLIVQNATAHACQVVPTFFTADGDAITTHTMSLAGGEHVVLPTAALPDMEGRSGSIRITHDCGYDALSGKAVAVEPATGFTFDTPLVPRPH
jgi:hypothetical protein